MKSATYLLNVLCSALWAVQGVNALIGPPPVTGPLLPIPDNLSTSETFQSALSNLTEAFDTALQNASTAGFPVGNTSFSVAITSANAPANDHVLWEYHHLARERDPESSSNISGSSQYLIASISKVFTDLLVLKHPELVPSNAITTYLPELAASNGSTRWEEVTIDSLMSQTSAIVQNYGLEFVQLGPLYSMLGFPTLQNDSYPSCNVIGLNDACTEQELLTALANSSAVFHPYTSPAYGTEAFLLLGLALERVTGLSFAELLDTEIVQPLGLLNTGLSPGETAAAIVPPGGQSSWGSAFGLNNPGSGIYSSTNDLSRLARAILRYEILDTESASRAWLKPASSLAAETGLALVGRPWEIYRTATGQLTPNFPRRPGMYIYAKDGGLLQYSSRLALLEDYGIAFVCLTAGEIRALDVVIEAVLAASVPALEEVAREQTQMTYVGSYISSTDPEVNLTLVLDNGPGLKVQNLDRNGSSILEALTMIYNNGAVVAGDLSSDWRIYPTGIQHSETMLSGSSEVEVLTEEWRLGFDTSRFDSTAELPWNNVFKGSVGSWQGLDSNYYGGLSVDRFVLVKNVTDGSVISARLPALRAEVGKIRLLG